MAGLPCTLMTPVDVSTGTAAKTILLLRTPGANQRLVVRKWGIYFDGTSSVAESIPIRLFRTTEASVTGIGTAATPVINGPGSETPQATGLYNLTTEPSAKVYFDILRVHPQQGWQEFNPLDQLVIIPGGSRFGIETTAAASVPCVVKVWYEE